MFDLHGKTALVTGSNRGIGRSILLAFAEYGADVILHCRKPNDRADEVLAQAKSFGVACQAVYFLNGINLVVPETYPDRLVVVGKTHIHVVAFHTEITA